VGFGGRPMSLYFSLDSFEVGLHGSLADPEVASEGRAGPSRGDSPQDLDLTARRVGRCWSASCSSASVTYGFPASTRGSGPAPEAPR
jgi:hypothetical protein